MSEIWKPVPIDGFGSYYSISNLGDVRSEPRVIIRKNGVKNTVQERILRPNLSGHGYLSVMLNGEAQRKRFLIHRLVAKAFIENQEPEAKEVNHINGNKTDNRAANLEWCTSKENKAHAIKNGLWTKGKANNFTRPGGKLVIYKSINVITGEEREYLGMAALLEHGFQLSGVRRSIIRDGCAYKGHLFTSHKNQCDDVEKAKKIGRRANQQAAAERSRAKWDRMRRTRA